MFSQIITSFVNAVVSRVVNAVHGWNHIKFYFITSLIFLFSISFIYRDVVSMAVQNVVYNQIRFRDCRDLLGLQKELDRIVATDHVIKKYAVYLYQPKDHAFYKKAILTNSELLMRSPALQGIYLKEQPTINKELAAHEYYYINDREARAHADLQYMADITSDSRLFYALKTGDQVIGEIAVRFAHDPTPLEMEQILKELSPLLYNYIL